MFGWREIKMIGVRLFALLALAGVVGCGPRTVPPAYPPSLPNTVGGYTSGGGGNCGAPSGGTVSLSGNGTPYYSQLTPASTGQNYGDTMTLSLFYMGYSNADTYTKNIVGSASMYLPSLMSANSFPTANQQLSFCASSTSFQGSQPIPGQFNAQNLALAVTLDGIVQVPLLDPYSGYPGGFAPGSSYGGYGQEEVTIGIGTAGDCGAYLDQSGRIVGCVDVQIGPQAYGTTIRYYAQ